MAHSSASRPRICSPPILLTVSSYSALQLVPAGIICIGVFFLTESPRWLVKKGRTDAAVKNLTFLRNLPADHAYIQEEVRIINDAIRLEVGAAESRGRFSVLKEISLHGNRNRLAIGMTLMAFQNLTGINAINYYSPTVCYFFKLSNE